MDAVNYSDVSRVMNEFKYVFNVDPNYYACIHDRFIKAVSSGTVCLTNRNLVSERCNPYTYLFSKPESITQLIEITDKNYETVRHQQMQLISPFTWKNSAEKIIENYLKGTVVNGYAVSDKV